MKKILAATYEFFSRDPRAYKIDLALTHKYNVSVIVKNEDLSVFSDAELDFIKFHEKGKNKYIKLYNFWKALIREAKQTKPDIFIAHNYYLVWPAYVIKKKVGCKVVYDSYELYIPSKRNKLSKREQFFYYIEKFCIKAFDLVIAANEERARMMRVKFGLEKRPLSIMNISSSLFEREQKDVVSVRYPQLLQYRESIKLVYQGVLSADRELHKMIEILTKLDDKYVLIYVGDGPEKSVLQQKSIELGINGRVVFTGRVPMKDIASILAFCDYGIVSYPFNDYNNRYCAPNKIFEYPGAGLPMISSSQPTIVSITNQYDIVEFVDYANIKESAAKITEFTKRVNKYNASSRIQKYLADISWNNEVSKLLDAFNTIC